MVDEVKYFKWFFSGLFKDAVNMKMDSFRFEDYKLIIIHGSY